MVINLYCNFDFDFYPFDVQKCNFRLAAGHLSHKFVHLKFMNDSFQIGFRGPTYFMHESDKIQRDLPYEISYHEMPEDELIKELSNIKVNKISWPDYIKNQNFYICWLILL